MAHPTPVRTATDTGAGSGQRFRVTLEYAIEGDLRYLSHHDELRMLSRALVRARWPLRYSRGFNPRPRIVVPLPRSVGTAVAGQVALVELDAPASCAELRDRLAGAWPNGDGLRNVAPGVRATPRPVSVTYEVPLEQTHAIAIGPHVARLLALAELVVARDYGPGRAPRRVDIRPFIETIVVDGQRLRMRLGFAQQRTARPSEVITALDLAPEEYNHRVRRVEIIWNTELRGPCEVRPEAAARKELERLNEEDPDVPQENPENP